MTDTQHNLIVLLGATASGKTHLAVEIARIVGAEIISADSRQVYRGMDLGTGKDLAEYAEIPYHMIDIVDPGEAFDVFKFQQRFPALFEAIHNRDKLPLLCGGTGLYLDSILTNEAMVTAPTNEALRSRLDPLSDEALQAELLALQPEQHNRTNLDDRERTLRAIEIALARRQTPPTVLINNLQPLVFGLRWQRETLRKRITQRLKERLDAGMIAEVDRLHQQGVSWETLEFYGLEYRFTAQHLQGNLTRNDMVQKLASAIHQFAKRQDTWFRRMERRGCTIHWLEGEKDPLQQFMSVIATLHQP